MQLKAECSCLQNIKSDKGSYQANLSTWLLDSCKLIHSAVIYEKVWFWRASYFFALCAYI